MLRIIKYYFSLSLLFVIFPYSAYAGSTCKGWSGQPYSCPHLNCIAPEYYKCNIALYHSPSQRIQYSQCRCYNGDFNDGYSPGGKADCPPGEHLVCDGLGGNCKCVTYHSGNGSPPGDGDPCDDGCSFDQSAYDAGRVDYCRCESSPPAISGPCSDIDDNGICDNNDNPPDRPEPDRGDGCNGCPSGQSCQDGVCIPNGGAGSGNDCDTCDYPSTCIAGECWSPQGGDGTDCPDDCYFTGDTCYCGPLPDNDNDGEPDDFDPDDDNDGLNDDFDPDPNDEDSDNDGVPDGDDPDPTNAYDSDGDGTPDPVDSDPNDSSDNGGDLDGDGIPNNSDDDIDGDGLANDSDDTPYGKGGSGGGNPGSGGGGIPDGGGGPSGGGGGDDPPPYENPDQPDDFIDLCETDPSCDCIPRSYTYKGIVDYNGDCCFHFYKDSLNQMWCDCSSGDCTTNQSSDNNPFLAAEIAKEILKAQGKNITSDQLKEVMSQQLYQLSRDQNERNNFLNQQQHNRNQSLKQQSIDNTSWLNDQQHNRISALDTNQEARHQDLKQAIENLDRSSGSDSNQGLKDALIDPNATYSDNSTDGLQAADYAGELANKTDSFSTRMNDFFDTVQNSDLFSLPFGLFGSLPSSSVSQMNISVGKWGGDTESSLSVDFAEWSTFLDVLRTVLLILSFYTAFKILVVKNA